MNDQARQKGFTLLELMITVAIVAILAAIAIPSYERYVTRGWASKAKSALQDNALFMERMNMRFLGYTKTRDASTRQAQKITTSDLPVQSLCTGSCGRNYTFEVSVPSDDLSQYILVAYPTTEAQKRDKSCGAMVMTSSGDHYATVANTYTKPTLPSAAADFNKNKIKGIFSGTDVSSSCFQ